MGEKLRVLVVGSGTIGRAVTLALADAGHLVDSVSRSSEPAVDLAAPETFEAVFTHRPAYDACVVCAASVPLLPFGESGVEQVANAFSAKLIGQLAFAELAVTRLAEGGSVTLTAGEFPGRLRGGALGAAANVAIETFVSWAGTERPRGIRVNAVSPGWVTETAELIGRSDLKSVPAARVASAYCELVEGTASGTTIRVLPEPDALEFPN
jgi:NAD(P)-dependent dehydrogenase (short-subunit alcohol dehydrogenase family)